MLGTWDMIGGAGGEAVGGVGAVVKVHGGSSLFGGAAGERRRWWPCLFAVERGG